MYHGQNRFTSSDVVEFPVIQTNINTTKIKSKKINYIAINNILISFQNQGSHTDFNVRTNFVGSISLTNGWVGIGFNNAPKMV